MPRSRLYLLGAAALVAATVVVVLVVVVGSSSNGDAAGTTSSVATQSGSTTTTTSTTTTATPDSLLAGIPQKGATLGRPSAPVTIQVFEDPQCPFCREWNIETLPTVVQMYVRTGRVKLVYRGIEIIGPNSEPGLRAIYAAGQQNKLWEMADELYERQGTENSGWIDDAVIASSARAVGANAKAVSAAASTAPVTAKLVAALHDAKTYAVSGTPTFIVERPPALPTQLQLSALDPASFSAALDPLLQ